MVLIETRLQLAEPIGAAWGACEFTEAGGSGPVPAAWSGATNDGDRKRLPGCIVKLKSGADRRLLASLVSRGAFPLGRDQAFADGRRERQLFIDSGGWSDHR